MSDHSSRIPGFFKLSIEERVAIVAQWAGLNADEQYMLINEGLKPSQANMMIENVLGTYGLPLGVAVNFLVNGKDYLVPMAVEEPSVLAAVSNSAKVVREGGGFIAETSTPVMIGQIQILDVIDLEAATSALLAHKDELIHTANCCDKVIVGLGGGARDIEVRQFPETSVGPMLVLHLYYDVRDAMGANTINTALESMAPRVAELSGGRTSLRILSNLADRRTATARCTIPSEALGSFGLSGTSVARLIEEANAFAVVDPYRAATHNKGIMNGIDAVCIATGNDWRAIEAGAHSYAARNGRYTSLTDWHVDQNGDLFGELTLPMAVGIVGGATKVHPTARISLKILGVESASELAQVMAAVGLAQNLGAIRALATVGIQKGHMRLHARQVAMAAGATDLMAEEIADQLVAEGNIHITRAKEILEES
ncbi:MAG TPA: hydroxymethylglutaryl-CoA reductase, degradative [candidate division Zixibacteria bacterium]|nr:hydroxymethylglutaryl-CoA reductase, degradative [candidate division Zixibacteria bacterium]